MHKAALLKKLPQKPLMPFALFESSRDVEVLPGGWLWRLFLIPGEQSMQLPFPPSPEKLEVGQAAYSVRGLPQEKEKHRPSPLLLHKPAATRVFLVSRKMLETCGDAENLLAMELSHHEVQVEKDILEPLSQLTEVSLFGLEPVPVLLPPPLPLVGRLLAGKGAGLGLINSLTSQKRISRFLGTNEASDSERG